MVLGCEMVFFRNNQEGERREGEGRNTKEESGAKR